LSTVNTLRRIAGTLLGMHSVNNGVDATGSVRANDLRNGAFELHKSGRLEEAAAMYRRALDADPLSETTHNLLGTVLCALGELSDGERCFRTSLQINPYNAEALNNFANIRKEHGDFANAENLYQRALELRPNFAPGWNNLGLLYMTSGRMELAASSFARSLSIEPSAEAQNNLGAVFRMTGQYSEAEARFRAAIVLNPALPEAWCSLADVVRMRGSLDEAEACCKRALELRPDYADAFNNLATVSNARRQYDIAERLCGDALRVDAHHVGALNNLATIAANRGEHQRAEAGFRKALNISPSDAITRFNLATTLLTVGEYGEGFELYENRFEAFHRPYSAHGDLESKLRRLPRWRGELLVGKHLLVWTEQGLGDSVMMLRYLLELRARGAGRVSVLCENQLARLVRTMGAADDVLTEDEEAVGLEFSTHVPMLSLPHAFGTHAGSIPGLPSYLQVPSSMTACWRARLSGSRPKIGLVWAGSRTLRDDSLRSVSPERFAPLIADDRYDFVSLQKGVDSSVLISDQAHWIDECNDLLDTSALITALDAVVSVDTAVAHLAGALGKRVWLLNRFASDWRWGMDSTRSAWYPSMTILRQPRPGDWDSVVHSLHRELNDHRGSTQA
jgi:tetratricopeptide (TPR) repeat protein